MDNQTEPAGPPDHYYRHLSIAAVIVGIAAALVSIWQGVGSVKIGVLILAACLLIYLIVSGVGRRKLVLGTFSLSWNVLGAVLLLVMLGLALATPWQAPQKAGFDRYPVDRTAPRPKTVASAGACVADLKRQYSCHEFRELVATSKSILMSDDPEHATLDEPLELAIAIGQGKMLTEGMNSPGDYCALYESSISEACDTLAGGNPKAPR